MNMEYEVPMSLKYRIKRWWIFNVKAKILKLLHPNAFVIVGEVEYILRDPSGRVKQTGRSINTILYVGNDLIRKAVGQLTGQPAGAQYQAIGTDSTAPAKTQTGLIAEVGTRVQGTYSEQETGAGYKDQWKNTATFGSGNPPGGATLRETGCVNASTGGTFLNRALYSPEVVKGDQDSLESRHTFSIT